MESQSPGSKASMDARTLVSFYSDYLWNCFTSLVPSEDSYFLRKISSLFRRTFSGSRKAYLPLPLPSCSPESYSIATADASRACSVLEDVMSCVLSHLHNIQKNLQFWWSRAEGSNSRKAYFMIFERGPFAFVDAVVNLLRDSLAEGSAMQHLCHSASAHMSERIRVLMDLRFSLATFLAQLYVEVDKCGQELVSDPEKTLPRLLITINGLFSNLEASTGHLHAARQNDSSIDGSYPLPLMFEKLAGVNQEGSQWTECERRGAINVVYQNLDKLESYLSLMVAKHRKPKKVTLYWIRYTCGAVGLSVCSIWLLRHSTLMGSSDIENWIGDAKEATISFFSEHVEQPLLSIRDELFETFRKRHKGVMEAEEVQLTQDSLRRMLQHFCKDTTRSTFPDNATDQEMLEIVMSRYEKELAHPIHNLVNGELARGLLIQVQKLKLDIETAMLELDQILRANEINFAVLAALPALFLSFLLFMLMRAWLKQDSRAEGRGRLARRQRRLLVVEVEKRIMLYENYINQGLEKDAECMYGLIIYSLDRLYRAVEWHAKATGEWQWLRQDLIELGKPNLQTTYKLAVTSRLIQVYECLLPSLKRQ